MPKKAQFVFTNQEISRILTDVSAVYQVLGENRFKVIAYQRAADVVKHASLELSQLWENNNLQSLAGIGPAIAGHLDELFKTGQVKHFNQIFSRVPPSMLEFLKIPGIGPATALKLSQALGIKERKGALEKLQQKALGGKIKSLPGFGPQTEANILKALERTRETNRLLLSKAFYVSSQIMAYLKNCPYVKKADVLGSLRRRTATVGDIDIAVLSNQPEKVINCFVRFPGKLKILQQGQVKASLLVQGNIQVDLMVEGEKSYGNLLQHFTGSKDHNIQLRELALKKGLSLSEHGVKSQKGMIFCPTEEKLYQLLEMDWIPPELREGNGEISASLNHRLPELVQESNLRGDLHIHSSFDIETSHDEGKSGIEEIYQKAREKNYQYLGLSEHNPSQSGHSDNDTIDLIKRKKEYIEQFINSRTNKLFIFNSLEIDIRPNGQLAVASKVLDYLDYAVVSIHSSFEMEEDKMTARIISGLQHPKALILGHPTGRILNSRQAIKADWDKIFDFCFKNNKFLEVNSWPDRLDLPDFLIKKAITAGVKLVINSDSHQAQELDQIKFGVFTARRGWARASDILNTLSYNNLIKILKGGDSK